MKIEIDQSGRIEYTNKPTVIGFSNSKDKTIIIFSTKKQKLQRYFRKIGKPRLFVYATFAFLIYLLLKHERGIDEICIDEEYTGQGALIKNYLLIFFRKSGREMDKRSIYFTQIGKKARIHGIVIDAYRCKKADIKITTDEIMKYLAKIKSGVW